MRASDGRPVVASSRSSATLLRRHRLCPFHAESVGWVELLRNPSWASSSRHDRRGGSLRSNHPTYTHQFRGNSAGNLARNCDRRSALTSTTIGKVLLSFFS